MSSSAYLGLSLTILVAVAAGSDLRSRRIPNWLTAAGLMTALAIRSFGGVEALGPALLMAGVVLIVTLPFFAAGGLGGGDVKLMVAVAAHLTPGLVVKTIVCAALVGGILSVAMAIRRRAVIPLFLDAGQLALNLATFGRAGDRRTLGSPDASATAIPYGVAIGIGALAAWYL